MQVFKLFLAFQLLLFIISPSANSQETAVADKPQQEKKSESTTEEIPRYEKVVRPFLWKIESKTPSYIFGTIHVSDERVLKMHPIAREIFEKCDTLFLEVKPEDALKQMKSLILPFGEKLDDLLDKETLARLDKQLEEINPVFAGKHRPNYKIWAWPLILPNLEAQLKNPKMEVLDFKLASIASDEGKYIGSLEDANSQMKGLASLTKKEQTLFLQDALTGMEKADKDDVDYEAKITNLYLSGNAKKVQSFFVAELENGEMSEELTEKILDAILYERNKTMAETIQKTLSDQPDKMHFFAAGTAHFVGPKSVQRYLRRAGLKISRVKGTAKETANR